MRRVLVVQHHADSPLGVMAPVLRAADVELDVLQAEHGCDWPRDAMEAWGLVVLGGAMSANDDGRCPHFGALLETIRQFTAAGRPVLGICLGGQLIARALGGRVVEGQRGEFGFVELRGRPAAHDDPLLGGVRLPVPVMQWHEDHFELPPGAVHLLASDACPAQAFRAGRASWGFQCHLEVDAPSLQAWAALRARLTGDPAVPDAVAAAAERHHATAMAFGRTVAERWLALV
jgi:GMP synthase-like glutamine amidotransferase